MVRTYYVDAIQSYAWFWGMIGSRRSINREDLELRASKGERPTIAECVMGMTQKDADAKKQW